MSDPIMPGDPRWHDACLSKLPRDTVAETMALLVRQLEAWRLFGLMYRTHGAEAKDTREALRLAEEA